MQDKQISIKFSQELLGILQQLAKENGMSRSGYIKYLILQEFKKEANKNENI